jgi:hypothetical protein
VSGQRRATAKTTATARQMCAVGHKEMCAQMLGQLFELLQINNGCHSILFDEPPETVSVMQLYAEAESGAKRIN